MPPENPEKLTHNPPAADSQKMNMKQAKKMEKVFMKGAKNVLRQAQEAINKDRFDKLYKKIDQLPKLNLHEEGELGKYFKLGFEIDRECSEIVKSDIENILQAKISGGQIIIKVNVVTGKRIDCYYINPDMTIDKKESVKPRIKR